MSTLELSYRTDRWLRLAATTAERDRVVAAWLEDATGWSEEELAAIVVRAASAPTFTEDAERFLLVADDRTWFVLEVSLLSGDGTPLDPESDFGGQAAEPITLSPVLSGYRLITMESAGPVEGLNGGNSDLLLPRLHYFLELAGDDRGWVYAGMQVADPMALPVIVTLVEELLAGVAVV